MDLNASMNTTMTERFGVAGALLVKLFGRYDRETASFAGRAGKVRDIGVKSALYSRVFFAAMGLLGSVGAAVVYLIGGHLVLDGTISLGTLVALGTYVTRLYGPLTQLTNVRVDLMAAFVSFERVFEVLRAPHTEEPTNWSRRYKANLEKLASGDVNKVAEVVRDLWRREKDRGLSAGEKRMLSKARQILVSELTFALNSNEDKAEAMLDEVLGLS